MNNDDLQKCAKQLQMSPTMQKVAALSAGFPHELSDTEGLRAAFNSCLLDMAEAMDNGEIQFRSMEASGMFHGLLCLALKVSLGEFGIKKETLQ